MTGLDLGQVRQDFVPKVDYLSREVLELEKQRLWPAVWLMACREEEVESPGDYVTFDIADESILVLRTQSGELKAFYNVCQHRGRRLKDDEAGNTGGQIFCPFHAWRYDLDGAPIRITAREDWEGCPDFREDGLHLKAVRVDTWGGWVWVTMSPDVEPLLDYLAPVPRLYRNFDFEKCRIGWYVTLRLPCNWKTMLDAFNEAYHVEGAHPQMAKFGSAKKTPTAVAGRHGNLRVDRNVTATRTRTLAAEGPKVDVREKLLASSREINDTLHALQTDYTVRAAERLLREVPADAAPGEIMTRFRQFHREEMEKVGAEWPANLTDQDVAEAGGTWHIFPNTIILSAYDGAMVYRAKPDGDDVDSCLFDVWWCGRYGPGQPQPAWTHETFLDLAEFKGRNPFLEQDFGNVRQVQRGMKSRGFSGARTNPYQEATVANFHRTLHQYLRGEAP
jgi:phenylpropionate dioxygenase-like ring-hydroxylating dioxygenase large terminal subunit